MDGGLHSPSQHDGYGQERSTWLRAFHSDLHGMSSSPNPPTKVQFTRPESRVVVVERGIMLTIAFLMLMGTDSMTQTNRFEPVLHGRR